jgi:arylsulfatase B
MDALVSEGILLDRHYVFSFCSPSRSALHTGRNPIHVNVLNSDLASVNLADPISGFAGLPRNITALPSKLAAAGYTTIQSGKWHIGLATPDHTPHGRGYAHSLSYLDGANDYWSHTTGDWCKNGGYTDLFASLGPAYAEVNAPNCSQTNQPPSCRYEDKIFADFAAAAVHNASAGAPIFLYFAPHNCHLPLEVPDAQLAKFAFINDSDARQRYSAMVNLVDAHIGQVVDAFKAKGLWGNTLMIVTADK